MTTKERRSIKLFGNFEPIDKNIKLQIIGQTKVYLRKNSFDVVHTGNMGSNERSINSDLKIMTKLDDTLTFWRNHRLVKKSTKTGSADYLFEERFMVKNDSC